MKCTKKTCLLYDPKKSNGCSGYTKITKDCKHFGEGDLSEIEKAIADYKDDFEWKFNGILPKAMRPGSRRDGSKVKMFDLDGNYIKTFDSMVEASKYVKVYPSAISSCCRGLIRSAGGYYWQKV